MDDPPSRNESMIAISLALLSLSPLIWIRFDAQNDIRLRIISQKGDKKLKERGHSRFSSSATHCVSHECWSLSILFALWWFWFLASTAIEWNQPKLLHTFETFSMSWHLALSALTKPRWGWRRRRRSWNKLNTRRGSIGIYLMYRSICAIVLSAVHTSPPKTLIHTQTHTCRNPHFVTRAHSHAPIHPRAHHFFFSSHRTPFFVSLVNIFSLDFVSIRLSQTYFSIRAPKTDENRPFGLAKQLDHSHTHSAFHQTIHDRPNGAVS